MLTQENYASLAGLRHPLNPSSLRHCIREASDPELAGIIRLFVTETIPAAFRDCPIAYEHIRHVVAELLNTKPKHVCLMGSARLGFATPVQPKIPKRWGRPMGAHSDLDLFAVDGELFERCVVDVNMVAEGEIKSRKPTHQERLDQEARWRNNVERMRRNSLRRGFFDVKYLPVTGKLQTATRIRKSMHAAQHAFDDFPFELVPTEKPSLRIYKSWDATIKQVGTNLREAAKAKDPA